MKRRSFPLYLITGLVLGLALGALAAWYVAPAQYVDTAPGTLNSTGRDRYRVLVALAYQGDGDLGRARARLDLLGSTTSAQDLAAQAQRQMSLDNTAQEEARALALLASALTGGSGSIKPAAPAVATPTTYSPVISTATTDPLFTLTPTLLPPTATATNPPEATATQRPTITPLPTLAAPFRLLDQKEVCDTHLTPGLLQIEVQDENGKPLAGVAVVVGMTGGGEERFYTGLYPDRGYADFVMTAGFTYSVRVGESSELAENITPPPCSDNGAAYSGGVVLIFGP